MGQQVVGHDVNAQSARHDSVDLPAESQYVGASVALAQIGQGPLVAMFIAANKSIVPRRLWSWFRRGPVSSGATVAHGPTPGIGSFREGEHHCPRG
jgi:hypothetical protein